MQRGPCRLLVRVVALALLLPCLAVEGRVKRKALMRQESRPARITGFPMREIPTVPEHWQRVIAVPLAQRIAGAPVVRIDLLAGAREATLAQLSLADINRYQFRRNRSDEPGLPVQRAAESPAGTVEAE